MKEEIKELLTGYRSEIIQVINPDSGFIHPGVGVTKEILENLRTQICAGIEPWKSYFENMLLDTWYLGENVEPSLKVGVFNNRQFISDSCLAYAQALMYFITGNNVYRRNAMNIIRVYETIDPETLEYFTDACIHTGIPTNRICIAAEILRYSTYEVTDGYTEAELAWTEKDTERFIGNFLSPEVEVFQYSPDRFMNQHLYTTIGAMSAYLFMDDAESYEKSVEWFTVNKSAHDQGFNGSIKRLFREITTLDAVGSKEGSGIPLEKPVIQHVEMGRDQAHGCGDLTNSAILSRLMRGQGTKVDRIHGTVSEAVDAVDCFAFLDDRMVKAADFFFQYMLGYDAKWVPVPFAMEQDGTIRDSYMAFAAPYRGRYETINFWDFYTYYAYDRRMMPEKIKEQYPYFYEGYQKKTYTSWDNRDGGGDFWVFLPAQAAGDTSFLPALRSPDIIKVVNRGALVTDKVNSGVRTDENGRTYFRFLSFEGESRVAMNSAGIEYEVFLFCVRTDGIARLIMSGTVSGILYLPDTKGKWAYVTYPRSGREGMGDIYYFSVFGIEGTYVDIESICTNPAKADMDAVIFESGMEEYQLTTYIDAPFSIELNAFSTGSSAIAYKGVRLPKGAVVDAGSGNITWTPDEAGEYSFYIEAQAGNTIALKKMFITVGKNRTDAVGKAVRAYDEKAVYTRASRRAFQKIWDEILTKAEDETVSDAAYAAKLNELSNAVTHLELVSPLLKNDPLTDGTSLDFSKMNLGDRSTIDTPIPWLDAEPGSFVGFWQVEDKGCIMDFGAEYKISVNKFGFQARAGFSDRLAGMQAFGSNDRLTWVKLTVAEAAYQQGYQTVDVAEEYHNTCYRYLMFKKTNEYADVLSGSYNNLVEFGELRIWGTRYEIESLVESVSLHQDGR